MGKKWGEGKSVRRKKRVKSDRVGKRWEDGKRVRRKKRGKERVGRKGCGKTKRETD